MSRVILTDGGMGQELVRRSSSAPTPLWSARVLIDEPDLVRDLHREFIEAGARVVTINTYSATPERLAREGVPELFKELQARGIQLAQQAREEAERPDVSIAGCLPPLFGSYAPRLTISYADTLDIYRRIVAEQAGQVDLFLCETMASAEEARAAATAAGETDKPVWVSWTLDDDAVGLLRSGETLAEAADAIADLAIAARLVNCSRPETIDAALGALKPLGAPVGAYANGFTETRALKHGGTVDVLHARHDLDPAAYAAFALAWVDAGLDIVGGCCEVGPSHIEALRDRLVGAGHTLTGAFDA